MILLYGIDEALYEKVAECSDLWSEINVTNKIKNKSRSDTILNHEWSGLLSVLVIQDKEAPTFGRRASLRQPVDILWDGNDFTILEGTRIEGWFHGTGCVFSASLTASIARGKSLAMAFKEAREFVQKAIRTALKGLTPGLRLLQL